MKRPSGGFTLIELLVVIVIIGILGALVSANVRGGLASGRSALCTSNLRQMETCFQMYLDDHEGAFFPFREDVSGGVLWYWGFESGGGAQPGTRPLDKSRGRMARYLAGGNVELCPDLPYREPYFMQKFECASYGYGINVYMLAEYSKGANGASTIYGVTQPANTVAWGDAIQVNNFQAPASASNPMLEEWYWVSQRPFETPKFHFRHRLKTNLAFADGSVRAMGYAQLLKQCDGRVGYLEPRGQEFYMSLVK